MKHQRQEKGFTLLEIVLVMTILVFIVGIAYGALSQITSGKKILDDRRELQRVAQGIFTRITRELQLADPNSMRGIPRPPGSKKSSSVDTKFEAEEGTLLRGRSADTMTFMAREAGQYLPDGGMHTGTVMITYRVERPPDEERPERGEDELFYLVRDELPMIQPFDYDRAAENRMTFPVAKNVLALKLRYFDRDKEEWTSEWQRAGLPAIVSISLKLQSRAGRKESYHTQVAMRFPQ